MRDHSSVAGSYGQFAIRSPDPASSLTSGFNLHVTAPPYESTWALTAPLTLPQPRASVLVVNVVDAAKVELAMLREVVQAARRRGCAAALAMPEPLGMAGRHVVLNAYPAGFRAVLLKGDRIRPVLRRSLSSPYDLAGDWMGWMRLHQEMSGPTADLLSRVIRHAPEHFSITGVCDAEAVPSRTLRYRCEREGLPNPERWFDASRLIHAILRLQREPGLTLNTAAEQLGYADGLSFSNRVSRVFGVTAETTRGLFGIEWCFHWWRKLLMERRASQLDLAQSSAGPGPQNAVA